MRHGCRGYGLGPIGETALCLVFLGFLLASAPAPAREIAGVSVPENVTLPGITAPLVLNGAGIRTKFFFKIYVGALYLPQPETRAETIVELPGPDSVQLFFLYHEVSTAQLVDAWSDGFGTNLSEGELKTLKPQIDQFNGLFHTVHRGDVVRLDYLPDKGTQVWINDDLRGTVPGADFHRALLRIWLGAKPADGSLKKAMLGGDP